VLILSRQLGEKVVLSGGITIEVVDLRHGKVKLGFSAPPEIEIDRLEIFEDKQRKRAVQSGTN